MTKRRVWGYTNQDPQKSTSDLCEMSWDNTLKSEERVEFLSAPIQFKTDKEDSTWLFLRDPDGALLELLEIRHWD